MRVRVDQSSTIAGHHEGDDYGPPSVTSPELFLVYRCCPQLVNRERLTLLRMCLRAGS